MSIYLNCCKNAFLTTSLIPTKTSIKFHFMRNNNQVKIHKHRRKCATNSGESCAFISQLFTEYHHFLCLVDISFTAE